MTFQISESESCQIYTYVHKRNRVNGIFSSRKTYPTQIKITQPKLTTKYLEKSEWIILSMEITFLITIWSWRHVFMPSEFRYIWKRWTIYIIENFIMWNKILNFQLMSLTNIFGSYFLWCLYVKQLLKCCLGQKCRNVQNIGSKCQFL